MCKLGCTCILSFVTCLCVTQPDSPAEPTGQENNGQENLSYSADPPKYEDLETCSVDRPPTYEEIQNL